MVDQDNIVQEDLAPLMGVYPGHVVEVKKHRFKIFFKGADGTVYQIELKRKKLNEKQKAALREGLQIRADFSTNKVYFKISDEEYI